MRQDGPKVEERPTVSGELKAKRERQLAGLEAAFGMSFEEYAKNNNGEYPDLGSRADVESYVGARRILWTSIQSLDMVLKDVTRIALEVLKKLEERQKNSGKTDK